MADVLALQFVVEVEDETVANGGFASLLSLGCSVKTE